MYQRSFHRERTSFLLLRARVTHPVWAMEFPRILWDLNRARRFGPEIRASISSLVSKLSAEEDDEIFSPSNFLRENLRGILAENCSGTTNSSGSSPKRPEPPQKSSRITKITSRKSPKRWGIGNHRKKWTPSPQNDYGIGSRNA